MKVPLLFLMTMTALVTAARAAEPVELHTELLAEVRQAVVAQDRTTYRLAPATLLHQGQVVYYTVRITNTTPVVANKVAVSQMIPANTRYVPGSATGPGADIEFSVDGGVTFASAEKLKLEGSSATAPPDRYTHIRWRLRNPLAPGAVALARFRAIFN